MNSSESGGKPWRETEVSSRPVVGRNRASVTRRPTISSVPAKVSPRERNKALRDGRFGALALRREKEEREVEEGNCSGRGAVTPAETKRLNRANERGRLHGP